ncbi:hypothetical protein GCM10028806_32600 [Spirosoma terrae]|uniref:Outer membrane lipoprotein-sorting protein n=1 Tax=Spirosoma terrae TaxID=1968276 RepID=A0A6L9L9U9_9BACT|nr:hypothetical protein [Spirosoma terrae]NDU95573.1 hypothetical protein [Spirosoma terrae]
MKLRPHFLLLVLIGGSMCFTQPIQIGSFARSGDTFLPVDAKAVLIADQILQAAGGRKAWENTRYVTWNFMEIRKVVWDKQVGNVRIDNLYNDQTVLLNLNNNQGIVSQNGSEVFQPDTVIKYVRKGIHDWAADTYWLFMPFKLKDTGVSLRYLGDAYTKEGKLADALLVTFPQAAQTPATKYKIWVDKSTRLITQYASYRKLADKQPGATYSLTDYQQYGTLLLPSRRDLHKITDIMVFSGLPGEVFSDFNRTDLSRYPQVRYTP